MQGDEWWADVSLPILEHVRRHLRLLVQFIEKHKRKVVYTDFEDQIGEEVDVQFRELTRADDFEKFRRKTRTFLADHHADAAIDKIHRNEIITADDVAELQRILIESGVGSEADLDRARAEAGSIGLFIRRLVGLDRGAAKGLFAAFLDDKRYNVLRLVRLIRLLRIAALSGTLQLHGDRQSRPTPTEPSAAGC